MARFEGRVAVVVGAGRREGSAGEGIGALTARLLADEGAHVVLGDIRLEAAQAVEEEIRRAGGEATSCVVDAGDASSVETLFEFAVERYRGVDAVHYNCAAGSPEDARAPIVQIDLSVLDEMLEINVRGFVICLQQAVPRLVDRGGGAIVYTSSSMGLLGSNASGAYGASKAAGNQIVRHIATAYGKRGIRCNAVAPGLTLTHGADPGSPVNQLQLRHRLTTRLGVAADQAKMIVYLLSDDAGYITGQTIVIDGGGQAHVPQWADTVEQEHR